MVEKKLIRVLHVLTGLSSGGAESFIMNMYRNMDRSKVQFDFLLRSTDNINAGGVWGEGPPALLGCKLVQPQWKAVTGSSES